MHGATLKISILKLAVLYIYVFILYYLQYISAERVTSIEMKFFRRTAS